MSLDSLSGQSVRRSDTLRRVEHVNEPLDPGVPVGQAPGTQPPLPETETVADDLYRRQKDMVAASLRACPELE